MTQLAVIVGQVPVAPLLDGLSLGIMLALTAIGLTLVFGFLGIVNFAHGAIYMLGGYMLVAAVDMTGNFWIGLLAAPFVIGVLGYCFERLLLRPTYHLDPLVQMLITFGLTFMIGGVTLIVWGGEDATLVPPELLTGQIELLGITYPKYRLSLIFIGSALILATWMLLRYTRVGLLIRASLVDKEMVQAYGTDIEKLYTAVFVFSVALTALAAAFMVPQRGVGPTTGGEILLDTFIVVVIGGLGSFRGTIAAGIIVGLTDVFATKYLSFRLSGLMIFIVLILVLIVRPRGLFGAKGVFTDD